LDVAAFASLGFGSNDQYWRENINTFAGLARKALRQPDIKVKKIGFAAQLNL
jgi:hypothetical protein